MLANVALLPCHLFACTSSTSGVVVRNGTSVQQGPRNGGAEGARAPSLFCSTMRDLKGERDRQTQRETERQRESMERERERGREREREGGERENV